MTGSMQRLHTLSRLFVLLLTMAVPTAHAQAPKAPDAAPPSEVTAPSEPAPKSENDTSETKEDSSEKQDAKGEDSEDSSPNEEGVSEEGVASAEETVSDAAESESEPEPSSEEDSEASEEQDPNEPDDEAPVAVDPEKSQEAAASLKETEEAVAERKYSPWLDVDDTKFDWIRMTSGEWLKGEMKKLRDGDLKFDSDEFDMQTLDWADVSDLHSPNHFLYVLDDNTIHAGTAEMADGKLIVTTSAGPRVFEKSHLMTIVPENTREISKWSFKLSLGATGSYGNSEVIDYSAYSRLRREDAFNRITAEYNGAFGLVSSVENTNKQRGNGTWNIYISPVFYLTPFYGELLYDKFRNIQLQSLALTGVGFHVVKSKALTLDLEGSVGYITSTYITTETAAEKNENGMAAAPRLIVEWDITKDVEFELNWKTVLRLDDIGRSFHQGTARLEIDITDIFDFDISADYSRQESPVADEDGLTPEKDDLTVSVGVGLEFD